MDEPIVLTNGVIITPVREIRNGAIVIENERIKACGPASEIEMPKTRRVIDVKGAYISPGFIDLHLHGAWGGDVMGATGRDLELMSENMVQGGVTSFMPTTLTAPWPQICGALDCIEDAMKNGLAGAKIIGAHLEGPYINRKQIGAQNLQYVMNPNFAELIPVLEHYSCIRRVSAAPEIPGGFELGQELKRRKIIASIAHSDATYQEVLTAIECGYTHVTHIYSGMSGVRREKAYRVSGLIESTLLLDELTTEMIADGHHLPPSLMQLVLKAKGLDKVCLVTDSMAAAGMGPGAHQIGGLDVIIEADIPDVFEIPTQAGNYVAKLTDRSAFASSVATMDQLVRNMIHFVGLNVRDAVKTVTINPAKMQGLDGELGRIAAGLKADLTVFDTGINILLTMVNGCVKYCHSTLTF